MKNFKKYFIIPATPELVFKALTNSATIELWTGEKAEMQLRKGSEFSMWDGSISGKLIDFEENKVLQQEWYFGEQLSEVLIKLFASRGGTSMEVRQSNIPDDDYAEICEGWVNSYAAGLIAFFEEDF